MAMTTTDKAWFLREILRLDPSGDIVKVLGGDKQLQYTDKIRSDETRLRAANPEELVRALTICLLCSDSYGYQPERMYIEQTHSVGRPSKSTAQIDLVLNFQEEDGEETVFAMWEMKSPSEYRPDTDRLIEKQLFDTAPLISPSLLVYSTIIPQFAEIECITIDYKAHKSYARWDTAGRPAT